MTSSQTIPDSLSQIHSELDLLTMRSLELSQDLIISKLKMEQSMKEGFFLMAKARYSNTPVSALQIPSEEESEFEANVKLTDLECLRAESNVRIKYLSVLSQAQTVEEDVKSGLVHRKNQIVGNVVSVNKQQQHHDPLKWFGILVPQTLKQSAGSFGRAIEVAVECANVQNEIQGVLAREKYLRRLKAKMVKEVKN